MAEELLRRVLCDIDAVDTDVRTFVIEVDEVRVKVDLCGKHAAPVLKAFGAGVELSTTGGMVADVLPNAAVGALNRRIGGPRG